jgi:hypothetical protein
MATAEGISMVLVDKFLLPPNIDDAQRSSIVSAWVRKRRGISGRVIAIAPGEDGWVRQLGNKDGIVYYGVVERQCSPSLPRQNQRQKSW